MRNEMRNVSPTGINSVPITSGKNGNYTWGIRGLGNLVLLIGVICVICGFSSTVFANAVSVSNVRRTDIGGGLATVEFRLAQQNPFGNVSFDSVAFSDYIWVFVKFSETSGADGSWRHATLAAGGTVTPVTDNLGAFIRASDAGPAGANFTLRWNYSADSVAAINSNTRIKVAVTEMVDVPTGSFIYDAGGIGGSTFNNYGAGSAITVSATTDIPTGASAGWPNGYTGFYLAKYEISQQQYCDFLNTISSTDATSRYDATLYNTYGYLITYTGAAPYGNRYSTAAQNRGCNFLSWDDCLAYNSWAALRPMTEMEYEKAARGGNQAGANARTYPWGNTEPVSPTATIDGGTHSLYYANYGNIAGGEKPILVGWYLSQNYAASNPAVTGASVYGIADLAGNVWEHLVNCDWATVPLNGNGTTTWPASWPGAAAGKGLRGSNWGSDDAVSLRVSDRSNAGWANAGRSSSVGIRPARTK